MLESIHGMVIKDGNLVKSKIARHSTMMRILDRIGCTAAYVTFTNRVTKTKGETVLFMPASVYMEMQFSDDVKYVPPELLEKCKRYTAIPARIGRSKEER